MEKLNFVQNGVVKLPPGFRFHPTDEELVVQYLKRKAFSCPLPASIIPELDIRKLDPWDLSGDPGRERYFFSRREWKYPNGSRANRATGSGYWKATGCDKQVLASRSNLVVGTKKALVFYKGKPPRGLKTDWVMHEYRLTDVVVGACNLLQKKNSTQTSIVPMEEWVLCRIFLKKKSKKDALENCRASSPRRSRHVPIDYMNREVTESSSSSHSEASVITEVSSAGCPDEEISSFNSISSLVGRKNNH